MHWASKISARSHIVGGTRELDGDFRIEVLRHRIIFGNDLQIDPRIVHFTNVQFTQVIELALNQRILLAAQRAPISAT